MDNETKITYGVIAVVIVLLGGIALFLQPMSDRSDTAPVTKEDTTTAPVKKAPALTQTNSTTTAPMEQKIYTQATLTTSKGTIEIAFGTNTPLAVKNFGTLASKNYYDGVKFHRVIRGFMIQTGDPLSKDKANIDAWGTGGPGYTFPDELTGKEQYPLGTVAMANAGPNTNGSQFFIVTAQGGAPLPPSYTVFGKVTKGIETALAIESVPTTGSPKDRPLEDVVIEKVEVK